MKQDANVPALRPIAVRRPIAAIFIGEGVSKIDELVASGQIEARKSGKNLLILVKSLERYVANLPPAVLKSCGNYKKKTPADTPAAA
jgi:hypothetical protein